MLDEECTLLEELHHRLSQGEDVWQKRDARSTGVQLMMWFNAKSLTLEHFPFTDWFQVMETISYHLGAGQPISPGISQTVAVELFQTKNLEVRWALLNYLANRFEQGMDISEPLYLRLLCEIARKQPSEAVEDQAASYSKLIVKLIGEVTIRHHTYISQLQAHANCQYYSQLLLQELNKSQHEEFTACLTLISKIYEKTDEFFYTNDLRVLIDIIIRTMEDPPSEEAVGLALRCLLQLSCSTSFPDLKGYRKQQCLQLIRHLASELPGVAPACSQLLEAYR